MTINDKSMRKVISKRIKKYSSIAAAGKEIGISRAVLSGIVNNKIPVSREVAKIFGYTIELKFKRINYV